MKGKCVRLTSYEFHALSFDQSVLLVPNDQSIRITAFRLFVAMAKPTD